MLPALRVIAYPAPPLHRLRRFRTPTPYFVLFPLALPRNGSLFTVANRAVLRYFVSVFGPAPLSAVFGLGGGG